MKNLLFFSALFILSCQGIEIIDPETEAAAARACEVTNPLNNLPWLEVATQKATASDDDLYCSLWQVIQGNYQGKTVFITTANGALCCTCGNVVYDCDGEIVLLCNFEEEANISHQKVIWQKK